MRRNWSGASSKSVFWWGRPGGAGQLGGFDAHSLALHELLKLARLEHLAHNVAAADKFALHVKLGNRRPVGIFLDALADLVGGQDVDALIVDAEVIQNLHDLPGETALRKAGGALHEKHHV